VKIYTSAESKLLNEYHFRLLNSFSFTSGKDYDVCRTTQR